MPRDTSGVYTLPAGNPVNANTLIQAAWANQTMLDLAIEVTNSLDRNGRGSMLAPFKNSDGTIGAPGITFGLEPSTGIARVNGGELSLVGVGVERARVDATGLKIPFLGGKVTVSRIDGFTGGDLVLNTLTGQSLDFAVNGAVKALMDPTGKFMLGSSNAPSQQLHVLGSVRIQGVASAVEFFNLANTAQIGYLQANDAGGASNINIVAAVGSVKITTGGVDRTSWSVAGDFAHVGTLTQSGGNFNLIGAGTADVDAARVLSGSGNLILQHGSGNTTAFRNKNGSPHSVWIEGGNLSVGHTTDQGFKLAVNGNSRFLGIMKALGSAELLRISNDAAYIAGFNSADNVRTGYLQFSAGGDITLMRDGNASVVLGSNGINRWALDPNGHFAPVLNNTYALGTTANRAAAVYGVLGDFLGNLTAGQFSLVSGLGVVWTRSTTHMVVEANGAAGLQLAQGGFVRVDIGTKALFSTAALVVAAAPAHSASPTFDCRTSNTFIPGTVTSNITGITLSNPTDGQFVTIRFQQDGTGGRTITLGNLGALSTAIVAGAPATASLKVSYLNVMYVAGSNRWEGAWTVLP